MKTDAVRSSNYAAYNEVSGAWAALTAEHAADLGAMLQHANFDQLTPEQRMVLTGWASLSLSQGESV